MDIEKTEEMLCELQQSLNRSLGDNYNYIRGLTLDDCQYFIDSFKEIQSDSDALRAKLETTKRELMATDISWQNALAELDRLSKQEPVIQVENDRVVNFNPNYDGDVSNGEFYSAPVPAMPMHAFSLSDEDIEIAMHGKELPMDYDELKQFARGIERAIMVKAMPIPKQEPVCQDREMLIALMSAFDTEHSICENCGHQEETMYMDSANMLRDYLQSNPVPVQAAAIPEQPTKEMVMAGINASMEGAPNLNDWDYIVKIYKAMLSASPKP